jgi:hypothetical protein
MEFGMLKPIEAFTERGAVASGSVKPRAVLAVLLVHPTNP